MDSGDRRRLGSGDEHTLFNYGVTVAAVAVALLARWLFDPFLGDRLPYLTFFVAVALASWLGGLRTGLLATGLGFLLVLFFFVPPRMSELGTSGPHLFGLAMYLVVCLTFVWFGEVMRVAARREADQTERLRTTLASIGDAVITTDAEGRVTSLNAVAETVTGWVTADACGKPLDAVFNTVDEATRQPVENQASRALKDGVPVALTSHSVLIRKDGSARPIDGSAAPIRSKDGGIVGCVLVFRDITDGHRADEAMRRSEERFRLAADAVNGVIYEFDVTTGHVERQRGLYEVLGYRVDEVPPTAAWWWEQTHPDDREANEQHFRELVGNSVVSEYRVRHKDGRWLNVEDRAVLLRGDDGQPVKMFGCTVDVTVQKQADAELRRRETFISGVLGSITDGFMVVDKGWRLTFANDAIVHRFERRREEIVGGHLWEMLPEAVGNEAYVTLHRAMANRVTVEYELFYPPWQRWFLDRAFPTADGGLAVFTRDITDRKRAEGERQLLASIVENSPDFIGISDTHGNPVYGNRAAMELVGVEDMEQVRRSKISDYFVPEQRQFVAEVVLPAVVKDGRWCGELTLQHFVTGATTPVLYDLFRVDDPMTGEPINFATVTRDLTERKREDERLRQSEARLRRVFESNVVGMIRWDLDRSLILDANAEFLRMTGYAREDVTGGGLNFRDLTPAEWTVRNEQGIRTIRADGFSAPYEKEYFRKDGSRLPMIIAGTRFEDSPSEGMSFLIDISEMKQAEARLRASEERLRLVVESATDYAIFTMNTDGHIDGWNAGAARLFGYPEAEVVGQNDRILYTPEDAAQKIPEREMTKAKAEGRAVNERWHVRKDGQRFWGSGLVQPLRDGGDVVGFLTILRDMTEQRLYEERLRQSEERRRLALDAAELGMWHVDPATRACRVDARFRAIFGTTTEEWMDYEQAFAVVHPDDLPAVQQAVAAATRLEDPAPFAMEYRIIHPDGSHRWVFAKGRLSIEGTGPAGRLASLDGTMADVTERKQIEQEREQLLGRLKEADRKKDEFLATLAHELRNPLAPIRNGIQIMKLAGGKPDAVERARGMIERQVQQMAHLIDDLMDLSRINQGKIALQKTRVPLAEAIRDAVDTCCPLIEQLGHHLALAVPDEPIFVDGDATRLTQVFANLLNNAAKYTDRGGRLRLSVEQMDGEVVISVEDNGVGITPDMLPRVFDMFAQVERSFEKSQGGLGIGLNIVKKLVEMHGGAVAVVSAGQGRGSTFTVRLPVASSLAAVNTQEEPIETIAPARRRILVVDDNKDGATSLAEMLDIMGNDTQTAHDGLEALSVGKSFEPDVILLDLGMPRMNGFDACRCIRAEAWGKGVVMVAQTGWGQDDDKQKAKEAGFDLHMTKPIDPAALEKLLSEMLPATG